MASKNLNEKKIRYYKQSESVDDLIKKNTFCVSYEQYIFFPAKSSIDNGAPKIYAHLYSKPQKIQVSYFILKWVF